MMNIPFKCHFLAMGVMACSAALVAVPANAAEALPQPVFRFDFDNSSLANSGSGGGSLTIQNPAALSPDGAGVSGKENDYAFSNLAAGAMGSSATSNNGGAGAYSLQMGATNSFTVTGWMNPAANWGWNARLFGIGSMLSVYGNGGTMYVEVNGKQSVLSDTNAYIGTNAWKFFAIIYTWNPDSSSGTVDFYIGTPVEASMVSAAGSKVSNAGSIVAAEQNLRIGNNALGGTRPFYGLIDDLRLYSEGLDLSQLNSVRLEGVAGPAIPEPSYISAMVAAGALAVILLRRKSKASE